MATKIRLDRVEPTTGIEPFGRLVDQVMSSEPFKSARRVFWIVDNGRSHAGKTSITRMQDTYADARLIHLPIHATWLNQIELYFSIVQRKARTPDDFADLDGLSQRLRVFGDDYRQIARPFEGTNKNPVSAEPSPPHGAQPRLVLTSRETSA